MNENDSITEYADIIVLPHHQSPTRPRMSLYDRAAQFAPFAALSGYEEMVAEEARLTDSEIQLSDSETELINSIINEVDSIITNGGHPAVSITYFKPDPYKSGGKYEKVTGVVKRVEHIEKRIVFYGSDDIENRTIPTIDIETDKIIGISFLE